MLHENYVFCIGKRKKNSFLQYRHELKVRVTAAQNAQLPTAVHPHPRPAPHTYPKASPPLQCLGFQDHLGRVRFGAFLRDYNSVGGSLFREWAVRFGLVRC